MDLELWGCAIFGPKMAHLSKWEFFFFPPPRKSVNTHCSFHLCLSTCQKSKSDINLLMKYWRIRILKSHWSSTILDYNLRTRFFPSMQFSQNFKNHQNFRFTKIPDKTNDKIFLKSPKTLFLGHFWSVLPDGDFFKKIRLCHTQMYTGP